MNKIFCRSNHLTPAFETAGTTTAELLRRQIAIFCIPQ